MQRCTMSLLALCLVLSSTAALQNLSIAYELAGIEFQLFGFVGLDETLFVGGDCDDGTILILNATTAPNVRLTEQRYGDGCTTYMAVEPKKKRLYIDIRSLTGPTESVQLGSIYPNTIGPNTTVWSSNQMSANRITVHDDVTCLRFDNFSVSCLQQATVIGTTPPSIVSNDLANDGSTFYLLAEHKDVPGIKSVFALDVASFELRNVTRVPAGSSCLTAAHGVVYVAGDELLTIDGSTGRTLGRLWWGVPPRGQRCHVVYNGGVVYLMDPKPPNNVYGVNVSNLAAPFVQYLAPTLSLAGYWTAFGNSLWVWEASRPFPGPDTLLTLFRAPNGPPPPVPAPSPSPSPTPKPTPSPTPKPTPSPTPKPTPTSMCAVCTQAPCCDPYAMPKERCPDLSLCCDCGTDSCQCPST